MRRQAYLLALMYVFSVPVLLKSQGIPKNPKNEQVLSAKSSIDRQPINLAAADSNYVIGPEDVLNIDVWKEPEISRTVPVRTDGKISLPLLGDIQAAALGPAQLSAQIEERLRKILVNPQVTVIVAQMNSQRIYILGEITRAGTFPLLPNMTVLQALSNAGAFTQFANMKKIYIMRDENGKQITIPFDYKEVVNGHKPEQNIYLKTGDTVVIP